MIATLKGVVSEKHTELIIIDVGGVGYGVLVTSGDQSALQTGDEAKLYVYEHIRETSHDLYGFSEQSSKSIFEILLSVSGVGPRMALNMLSLGSIQDLSTAIVTGNTKYIQSASGVGKRLAERLVVDLKDKLGGPGVDLAGSSLLQSDDALMKDEAVAALVSLGYTTHDAVRALENVDKKLSSEDRVKKALKGQK